MKQFSSLAWLLVLWALISLACSLVIPPRQPAETQPPMDTPIPPAPVITLEGKIAYASERNGTWQIIAMNADGSDETSLTSAFGAYSRPAWSPDGRKIAMRFDISSGLGIAVMDVRHEGGILAGSQPIAIASLFADGPRWSPDGRQLVYSAAEGGRGWQTFIADLGAGSSRQIPAIPENSIDLDWSPDGSRIVFSYYTDPSRQIRDLFVINADGTGLIQLTVTPAINESSPAWSPDGTRIAFAAAEDSVNGSQQDVFIMNSDGSGLVQITRDPAGDFDPSWSPDGKRIAFVSERNASNDGNYEIYLINADGTGEMRLTNNRYTDRWPTWRAAQPQDSPPAACQPALSLVADVTIPPGTRFAQPQAFSKVWRVKNDGTCTWTPTSTSLRFVDGEPMGSAAQVMVPGAIQPGTEVDLILPLAAPETSGTYSASWQLFDGTGNPIPGPDGNPAVLTVGIQVLPESQSLLPQPLYFLSGQAGSGQLWRLETDARSQTRISSQSTPIAAFDISSNGRLAYVSQNQVFLTGPNGEQPNMVADLGTEGVNPALAWSPDGNRLAYALGGIRIYDLSTGEDRLLVPNNQTGLPGGFVYAPQEWSPDGTKILARVFLWESAILRVISVPDGNVLAEMPLEDSAWSNDSQSVFYAASISTGMMGSEPGLWRAPLSGEKPQALIGSANSWWPAQSPDGSLLFFMHPPTLAVQPDFHVFAYRAVQPGLEPQLLNNPPVFLSLNDTFNIRWTRSAGYYLSQIVRPALGVSEVLFNGLDGSPPLYLMQEIGQSRWGP